jgi:hypothetical protein
MVGTVDVRSESESDDAVSNLRPNLDRSATLSREQTRAGAEEFG